MIKLINNIREILSDNDLDYVFELIESYSEIMINLDSRNNIILLKNRYSTLKNNKIKGLISLENFNIGQNNITNDILSLLENIEEVIKHHEKGILNLSQNQKSFKKFIISKYLGKKGLLVIIKTFFTKVERVQLSLFLVKTNQYYLISCPIDTSVEILSQYIGEKLFPNLKGQHFIWRLEQGIQTLPRLSTVENSGVNSDANLTLTAEYKYGEELWGKSNKKITMNDDINKPKFGDF